MQPGKAEEVIIDMLPVSYQFKKGHKIRIAIAGADRDNFPVIPVGKKRQRTTIYKIKPNGERTLFADNLDGGPAGCCFDKWGNFYLCTFRDGKLVKIMPNGSRQVVANGLEGPIQMVSDRHGNLFVSFAVFGDAVRSKIYKFTPNGTKSVLADLFALGGIALSGMAIDKYDNLYLGNFVGDIIHKVTPTGTATVFCSPVIARHSVHAVYRVSYLC